MAKPARTIISKYTISSEDISTSVTAELLTDDGKLITEKDGSVISTSFKSSVGKISSEGVKTFIKLGHEVLPDQIRVVEIDGKLKLAVSAKSLKQTPEHATKVPSLGDSLVFDVDSLSFSGQNINIKGADYSCKITPFGAEIKQGDKVYKTTLQEGERGIPIPFNSFVSVDCIEEVYNAANTSISAENGMIPEHVFQQYSLIQSTANYRDQDTAITTSMVDLSKTPPPTPSHEVMTIYMGTRDDSEVELGSDYYNICKDNTSHQATIFDGAFPMSINDYKLIKNSTNGKFYIELHSMSEDGAESIRYLPLSNDPKSRANALTSFQDFIKDCPEIQNQTGKEVDGKTPSTVEESSTLGRKKVKFDFEERETVDEKYLVSDSHTSIEVILPEESNLRLERSEAAYSRFESAAEKEAHNKLTTKTRNVNKPLMQLLTTCGVGASILAIGLVTLLGPIGFGIIFGLGLAMTATGATIIAKTDAIKKQTYKIQLTLPQEEMLRCLVSNYNEYQLTLEACQDFEKSELENVKDAELTKALSALYAENPETIPGFDFLSEDNLDSRMTTITNLSEISKIKDDKERKEAQDAFIKGIYKDLSNEELATWRDKIFVEDSGKAISLTSGTEKETTISKIQEYSQLQSKRKCLKTQTQQALLALDQDSFIKVINPRSAKIRNLDLNQFTEDNVDALAEKFLNVSPEDPLYQTYLSLLDDQNKKRLQKRLQERKDKVKAREEEESTRATETAAAEKEKEEIVRVLEGRPKEVEVPKEEIEEKKKIEEDKKKAEEEKKKKKKSKKKAAETTKTKGSEASSAPAEKE